jgi:hypothetical protein
MSILLAVCMDNRMAAISHTHTLGIADIDQQLALDTEPLTTMMKSRQICARNKPQEEDKLTTDKMRTDTLSDAVTNNDELNLVANIVTKHIELVVVNEVKLLLLKTNATSHGVRVS